MVITSDYYAQPKKLVLHALNNSGKDIVGYTILIRHKNPDGTLDKGGWSASGSDMLNLLISIQMAKDPTASERIRQQNVGNEALNAAGNGIFAAGTTRDITMNGIDSGSELDFTAGVVFYGDGSFDKQDEDALRQMLATRQGQLLAMKIRPAGSTRRPDKLALVITCGWGSPGMDRNFTGRTSSLFGT